MNALITTELDKIDSFKGTQKKIPSMKGMELVSKVSTKKHISLVIPNQNLG